MWRTKIKTKLFSSISSRFASVSHLLFDRSIASKFVRSSSCFCSYLSYFAGRALSCNSPPIGILSPDNVPAKDHTKWLVLANIDMENLAGWTLTIDSRCLGSQCNAFAIWYMDTWIWLYIATNKIMINCFQNTIRLEELKWQVLYSYPTSEFIN